MQCLLSIMGLAANIHDGKTGTESVVGHRSDELYGERLKNLQNRTAKQDRMLKKIA